MGGVAAGLGVGPGRRGTAIPPFNRGACTVLTFGGDCVSLKRGGGSFALIPWGGRTGRDIGTEDGVLFLCGQHAGGMTLVGSSIRHLSASSPALERYLLEQRDEMSRIWVRIV